MITLRDAVNIAKGLPCAPHLSSACYALSEGWVFFCSDVDGEPVLGGPVYLIKKEAGSINRVKMPPFTGGFDFLDRIKKEGRKIDISEYIGGAVNDS